MPASKYPTLKEVLRKLQYDGTDEQCRKLIHDRFEGAWKCYYASSEELLCNPRDAIKFCDQVRDAITKIVPATSAGSIALVTDSLILRTLSRIRKAGWKSKSPKGARHVTVLDPNERRSRRTNGDDPQPQPRP